MACCYNDRRIIGNRICVLGLAVGVSCIMLLLELIGEKLAGQYIKDRDKLWRQ
jgi:hypothetical protein